MLWALRGTALAVVHTTEHMPSPCPSATPAPEKSTLCRCRGTSPPRSPPCWSLEEGPLKEVAWGRGSRSRVSPTMRLIGVDK